jgi:Fe-S oxidoreductase
MLTVVEKIIFCFLCFIIILLSWRSFRRMILIISRGKGKLPLDHFLSRVQEALTVIFTQRSVFKTRPVISLLHALIAWAFQMYLLVNIGDVLTGFIPDFVFLGRGMAGNIYRLFIDVFSVLAVASTAFFLVRRFIFKSSRLTIRDNVLLQPGVQTAVKRDSLIVGWFIMLHVGFRFIGQTVEMRLNGYDAWQPLASFFAYPWLHLSSSQSELLLHITWWIALGLILAFFPYFPQSKHAHLFMGPVNYLTRVRRSAFGTLDKIDLEDEHVTQFGVARLEDLHKTQIIDTYACIMCNRCQDVCPAYLTGKELSPSALEINKRVFINRNSRALADRLPSEVKLTEFAISEPALWACTTCAACVEVCPVGNEPLMDILEIRRDAVLMESRFPKQLQQAFTGMERNSNPWNFNKDRLEWVKAQPGLAAPTVQDNPAFEILYWVGCAGAFDQRGQSVARSFASILNKANVNFAVLGNNEQCTGDSARRAGNEYLFQMLAQANVEMLNQNHVKKIVTTCPHCLHTIKNEYQPFGGVYEVVHHAQFIAELIAQGRLPLPSPEGVKELTYHDPCYLGRHNRVFDAPRSALKDSGFQVAELERNRANSFCCGAGGSQMWKEEEKGAEAVRRERFREVIKSGAEVCAVACPFCLTMLRDAGNELGASIAVKDIAELIAERLP